MKFISSIFSNVATPYLYSILEYVIYILMYCLSLSSLPYIMLSYAFDYYLSLFIKKMCKMFTIVPFITVQRVADSEWHISSVLLSTFNERQSFESLSSA